MLYYSSLHPAGHSFTLLCDFVEHFLKDVYGWLYSHRGNTIDSFTKTNDYEKADAPCHCYRRLYAGQRTIKY